MGGKKIPTSRLAVLLSSQWTGNYLSSKGGLKPIFQQKLPSCWVANTREQETNYMKSTCPTQTQPLHTQCELYITGARWALQVCVGHYWLALEVALGSARVLGYQHVDIGNANRSHWGPYPTQSPNVNRFAFWWNISFTVYRISN